MQTCCLCQLKHFPWWTCQDPVQVHWFDCMWKLPVLWFAVQDKSLKCPLVCAQTIAVLLSLFVTPTVLRYFGQDVLDSFKVVRATVVFILGTSGNITMKEIWVCGEAVTKIFKIFKTKQEVTLFISIKVVWICFTLRCCSWIWLVGWFDFVSFFPDLTFSC